MTQWVEDPAGGRARGPAGLVRAWVEVLVRPRRFFRTGIAPGDQAPGLVFAVAVALCHAAVRIAFAPDAVPAIGGRQFVSFLVALLGVALVIAPLALHLAAAFQTILLMGLSAAGVAGERAGVSETVQVVAYATAPCALSGAPIPAVAFPAAAYGFLLLAVGLGVVHDLSFPRALLAAALPGAAVFGYGFRGLWALERLLAFDPLGPLGPPLDGAVLVALA